MLPVLAHRASVARPSVLVQAFSCSAHLTLSGDNCLSFIFLSRYTPFLSLSPFISFSPLQPLRNTLGHKKGVISNSPFWNTVVYRPKTQGTRSIHGLRLQRMQPHVHQNALNAWRMPSNVALRINTPLPSPPPRLANILPEQGHLCLRLLAPTVPPGDQGRLVPRVTLAKASIGEGEASRRTFGGSSGRKPPCCSKAYRAWKQEVEGQSGVRGRGSEKGGRRRGGDKKLIYLGHHHNSGGLTSCV